MYWCTVVHATGATSIDFEKEIESTFPREAPRSGMDGSESEAGTSRSSSPISLGDSSPQPASPVDEAAPSERMDWCTVVHSTGATSIDFDKEIEHSFARMTHLDRDGSEQEIEHAFERPPPCSELNRPESATGTSRSASPTSLGDTAARSERSNRGRTAYTSLTDLLILKCVDMFGPRWRYISRHMGGRCSGWTDDKIRNRFLRLNSIAPTHAIPRKQSTSKHTAWSADEDQVLLTKLQEHQATGRGVHWTKLYEDTFDKKRSSHAIRNRAYRLGFTGRQ